MRRWGLAAMLCTALAGAAGPCLAEEAQLSPTIIDGIRSHVVKFWSPPVKKPDVPYAVVEIRIILAADGSILAAEDLNETGDSSAYRNALAQSALQALHLASPLPIPRDKHDQFKDFVMLFNPKQMVGGR